MGLKRSHVSLHKHPALPPARHQHFCCLLGCHIPLPKAFVVPGASWPPARHVRLHSQVCTDGRSGGMCCRFRRQRDWDEALPSLVGSFPAEGPAQLPTPGLLLAPSAPRGSEMLLKPPALGRGRCWGETSLTPRLLANLTCSSLLCCRWLRAPGRDAPPVSTASSAPSSPLHNL